MTEWLLVGYASGVIIDEGDGAPAGPLERVSLITALSAEADVGSVVGQLQALAAELADRSGLDEPLEVETRPIEPKELERLVAPSFRPVELARGLWVAPAADETEPDGVPSGVHTVRLIPGLAFGTGQHPSTRLAARLVASWFDQWAASRRPWVLELGTGSGLLAIAAALWGAALVVGIEKDSLAVDNARRNVEANGLAEVVALVAADLTVLEPRPWADLLIANLDRDHFLTRVPTLAEWLSPGGTMVASGLLTEHADELLGAFRKAGLGVIEEAAEGLWVAWSLGRG